jgi:hypothetical protein
MIVNNINAVKKAITSQTRKIDEGARAARDEMMTTFIQLAQNEIKGQRGKVGSQWEKATPGEPPKNRTGNLRRSIRGEKAREGFASYTAIVGPTIIYGRSVEVGGKYAPPTWRNNEKFPYMQPAFNKFQRLVGSIIRKHLA